MARRSQIREPGCPARSRAIRVQCKNIGKFPLLFDSHRAIADLARDLLAIATHGCGTENRQRRHSTWRAAPMTLRLAQLVISNAPACLLLAAPASISAAEKLPDHDEPLPQPAESRVQRRHEATQMCATGFPGRSLGGADRISSQAWLSARSPLCLRGYV